MTSSVPPAITRCSGSFGPVPLPRDKPSVRSSAIDRVLHDVATAHFDVNRRFFPADPGAVFFGEQVGHGVTRAMSSVSTYLASWAMARPAADVQRAFNIDRNSGASPETPVPPSISSAASRA